MKNIFAHIQRNIVRGALAVVPLLMTYVVAKLLYVLIDKRIDNALSKHFGLGHYPGIGFILLLVVLYALGLLLSNILGRWSLLFFGDMAERFPLVGWLYRFGRELSLKVELADKKPLFQKAVLVNFPEHQQWMVGFVAGEVMDQDNQQSLLKVVIPMAHPTATFLFLLRPDQVKDTPMTVDEAFKLVISAGLIAPTGI